MLVLLSFSSLGGESEGLAQKQLVSLRHGAYMAERIWKQRDLAACGRLFQECIMRLLNNKRFVVILAIVLVYVFYSMAYAGTSDADNGEASGGHGGEVLNVLYGLIVVLLAAKLGGDLLERFGQPAVLGELIIGMLIGNLHLLGFDGFEVFKHDIVLAVLAEIGVIILLFQVGLESTVEEMMKVGVVSFIVAAWGW
jgi:hypothetical protein